MAGPDPAEILGPTGAIARRLPGYEARPQQLEMAGVVSRAVEQGGHLMVEAGTGVGKSFAYLVPAILAAAETGTKVVISTHTINLQEQLLEKDIPFLRAVMPHEFTAVLVKGRSNYISLRRLEVARAKADTLFQRYEHLEQLQQIAQWAAKTDDGSLAELPARPDGAVWEAVASDHGNCLGKKCPRYNDCHYYKARRRISSANILIVNHALYVSDLALRSQGFSLLPEHDLVIFDEAHTLEAVAGEHLGLRLASTQVEYHLNRLYNERTQKGVLAAYRLGDAIRQLQTTRDAARAFFEDVEGWQQERGAANGRVKRPTGLTDVLGPELRRLGASIGLGADRESSAEQKVELNAVRDRCEDLASTLDAWLKQQNGDAIYWIERQTGARKRVSLASAPLDVGPVLRDLLWDRIRSCIMTSATLAVGSPPSFAFARNRLGLTGSESLQLGSPFDYKEQATLYIPRNLPDPSVDNQAYETASIAAIRHYLAQTHGKALVLFTSHRHLTRAAAELSPWLAEQNIRLYAQSEGMQRSKMVEAFKADRDSVIFGAESFWQGVDVPGETLSNVIVVRLPFSVPDHPLTEARLEAIQRRGGNRFIDYQVPEAIIRLKQGFGRLIRHRTDRGIVVILDPRVLTKPYGRQFLDSLPACPRVVETLPEIG